MAYTDKEIEKVFESICKEIEKNRPVRQVLKDKKMPSSKTFFIWLDKDENKVKRYVRACEARSEVIFEDMFDIADDVGQDIIKLSDGREVENKAVIARDRLRVDTRKWILSKMNPKKYGDKLEVDATNKNTIEYINVSKQFPDKK